MHALRYAALRMTLTAGIALLCASASAQSRRPAPRPALQVKMGDRFESLGVRKLAVDTRIVGHLAETRLTTTFYNPHGRALSGEFVMPLPEDATVSGYGLDIGGVLVDGVVVDKDEGRRAFEKEVRKGVDPGLVEWTGGNSFKTRVFPIPAGGTRTIMVRYIAELNEGKDGLVYDLPMKFKAAIADFSMRVEVVQSEGPPTVTKGGPKGLTFSPWRNSFVAETQKKNVRLGRDLRITLPRASADSVRVERAADGEVYFSVRTTPRTVVRDARSTPPKRLRIAWDASASRADADLTRELGLLKRYLASLGSAPVSVDLAVVRDAAAPVQRFSLPGDRDALLATIEGVSYDGGTQLAALAPEPQSATFDLVLVFTDGVSNFGLEDPGGLGGPAWIFNSASTSNHAFLRFLAMQSGGAYLNLNRLTDTQALASVGAGVLTFLGARVARGGAVEGWPRASRPVQGPFTFAGKLEGRWTEVILAFGVGGQVREEVQVTVRAADASEGGLLRQLWAQKQLSELLIFPKRNSAAMTALGKAFSIVTPSTSLIVLENLGQYLEHAIRPPASLTEMRANWDSEMARRAKLTQTQTTDKIASLITLWDARMKWYDTTFTYPKGFRSGGPQKKGERLEVGGTGGMVSSGRGSGGGGFGAARIGGRAAAAPSAEVAGAAESAYELEDESISMSSTGAGSGSMRVAAEPMVLGTEAKKKGRGKAKKPAAIVLAPWDPKTPYLALIKAAPKATRYETYLGVRGDYGNSPAFFLDCAAFFQTEGDEALSIRVLSNIAEMELEDPALLRILAHRLAQRSALDLAILLFERILVLRPEEPQSFRDLALTLERRGDARRASKSTLAAADYTRALELLGKVVMKTWDRFVEIELIALVELNHILPKAKRLGVSDLPVDVRLIRPMELDVRIAMSWDADMTDMDMHIVEPSGEEAYYSHNRTTIGGLVSRDFTQGYGPEVYLLKKAMPGAYHVKTKFFGSSAAQLAGAVTLQVDIFTDYGRPNEKRRSMTFRLTEKKQMFTVGEVTL
ncbi:MAG: VIT domain-containing protein [Myxococcota bacterium]